MDKAFKIKRDGKFVTVARYETNTYGNLRLSINRKLLVDLLKGEGEWINLSVFDSKPKEEEIPEF